MGPESLIFGLLLRWTWLPTYLCRRRCFMLSRSWSFLLWPPNQLLGHIVRILSHTPATSSLWLLFSFGLIPLNIRWIKNIIVVSIFMVYLISFWRYISASIVNDELKLLTDSNSNIYFEAFQSLIVYAIRPLGPWCAFCELAEDLNFLVPLYFVAAICLQI